MKLNRRKALMGIGTLTVGSGAALGSGAFTQVNAERQLSVGVANDSNGFLGLEADPSSSLTTNAVSNTGGQLTIDLSGTNSPASGVNDEATTRIGVVSTDTGGAVTNVDTAAFRVFNNSSNPVDVSVSSIEATMQSSDGPEDILNLYADPDTGTTDSSQITNLTDGSSPDPTVNLAAAGNSGDEIYVVVEVDTNTTNDNTDDVISNITLTAETTTP
jgi:hypothetical protein